MMTATRTLGALPPLEPHKPHCAAAVVSPAGFCSMCRSKIAYSADELTSGRPLPQSAQPAYAPASAPAAPPVESAPPGQEQILAEAWLTDGRNGYRSLATTPGRRIAFRGGRVVIKDPRDLMALMRQPRVTLEVKTWQRDWLAGWLEQAGKGAEIKADVAIPGYRIGRDDQGFHLVADEPNTAVAEDCQPTDETLPADDSPTAWVPPSEVQLRRARPARHAKAEG